MTIQYLINSFVALCSVELTPNNSNPFYNELLEYMDVSAAKSNYAVEVLIVVDYAIYQTFVYYCDTVFTLWLCK